jgi:hypothetical protein
MLGIRPSTVGACVAVLAILTAGAMPASAQVANFSHIVVEDATGGPVALDRLKKVHQNLRQRLGLSAATAGDTSDLWRFKIGCLDCQKLDDGTATKVTYFLSDPTNLPVFIAAWEWVQLEDLSEELSITIDGERPDDPLCGPPLPSPCTANYSCPQFGNCSKKSTSCVRCQ